MEVKRIASKRGGYIYSVDNYLYECEKANQFNLWCRCVRKKNNGCTARATISKEPLSLVRTNRRHNHEPECEEVIRREVIQEMKERVIDEPEKSVKRVYRDVLTSSLANLQSSHGDAELGIAMPTYGSVSSVLHRCRDEVRPELPKTMHDIELNGIWSKTNDGGEFLQIDDSSPDRNREDRILGFASDTAMAALCAAPIVYMDGTFKVVPHLFAQLYALHGFVSGQMMPLAFFLLPDKTTTTYVRMFNLLRAHAATKDLIFRPRGFQLDFEEAALKAVHEIFPLAEVKGCNFHFGQCLWRSVQRVGLQPFYADPGVKTTVRSISALAFVPENDIDEAWLAINAESPAAGSPGYEELERFKEYFIRTWLENAVVFPRRLWNHFGNFSVRTTNHLEAWHRALNATVGKAHVNIFELIKHLKAQEAENRNQMLLLDMGQAPPRQRKKDVEKNHRLRKFVEEYQSGQITLIEYIRKVGANMKL